MEFLGGFVAARSIHGIALRLDERFMPSPMEAYAAESIWENLPLNWD
jgi:hypothetical protein